MWRVDESDLGGTDQWDDVGQGTQKDREATTQFDMFDALVKMLALATEFTESIAYKFGHHVGIQLDVALAVPVHIHVELDAFCFSLGDQNAIESQGHSAEVNLCEVECFQWPRKHSLEHRLSDLLDHLAASHVNVGPQLCDYVVEEVFRRRPSAEILLLWETCANHDSSYSFSTLQDLPACSPLPFAVILSIRVADMFANTRRL